MCDFNCPSFPDSLALSTGSSLTIGSIEEIQKLHIQTVPLGEMPKRYAFCPTRRLILSRIQHHPALKSYCVTTAKVEVGNDGMEKETHWVKLINDQTYEGKYSFS